MTQPPKLDCYDYVRHYYGVPAYIGVRVKLRNGREGVIVPAKHSLHYIHILRDGDRRSEVYHPTDGVEYFVDPRALPMSADAVDPSAQPSGTRPTRENTP
jgi:hypothetical protein